MTNTFWENEFIQFWNSENTDLQIPTSGSTGTPKLINISKKCIKLSTQLTLQFLGLQKGDTCLISLNMQYIGGKMMLARALEGNLNYKIIEPNSNPLVEITQVFDFYSFVPLQIQNILVETPEKIELLNQAKAIIIGGAAVNESLLALIQSIKTPVYSTYGMTETVSHIALKRLNSNKNENYVCLPSIKIDKDERDCLTVEHAITNHIKIITNDIIELISPTEFQFLGRADDVINSAGVKIFPQNVENELAIPLKNIGYEDEFFIHKKPHPQFGDSVILVVKASFTSEMFQELKLNYKSKLSKYYFPVDFVAINDFVYTQSGKIDKLKTLFSPTSC